MNLIENIENYFNEHKDFDNFTKIRYIYLYICKTFSYDLKYYLNNREIKNSIYNEVIDIKNVKKHEYVCSSISNALIDVLKYFGYEAILQKESDNSRHVYVIVECEKEGLNYKIKMDPTKRHDLTRVKLDSPTIDFVDLNNSKFFMDDLMYSDKLIKETLPIINHEEQYDTITIKELNSVINESAKNRNLSPKKLFDEKIEYIMCLINIRKNLNTYDDMDYYYSYIIRNFDVNGISMIKYLKTANFFSKDYNDMIWLTDVNFEDLCHYMLVLKHDDNGFKISKISKNQTIDYLKNYFNDQCQYIFENWSLSLDDSSLEVNSKVK